MSLCAGETYNYINMPKVSVIIPTYNRVELLKRSVNSVLKQTFEDFELIISDDASTDNTKQYVESISDQRVRYIRNDVNKGVSATRNNAIKASRGEYIAFLDDDDEWISEYKLEKQLSLLEDSPKDIGLIYTGAITIELESQEKLYELFPRYRGYALYEFIADKFLNMSTVVLRKDCLEKVGLFDERIPYGEDYDLWIKILREYKVDYINEPLVLTNHHDTNLTKKPESVIDGLEIVIKKNLDLLSTNKLAYATLLFDLGVVYCYNKDCNRGRDLIKKAIKLSPYNPTYYFNYTISLLGPYSFSKLKELKDKYLPRKVKKF